MLRRRKLLRETKSYWIFTTNGVKISDRVHTNYIFLLILSKHLYVTSVNCYKFPSPNILSLFKFNKFLIFSKNNLFKLSLFFFKYPSLGLKGLNRLRWNLSSGSSSGIPVQTNFKNKVVCQEFFLKKQLLFENFVDLKKYFFHSVITNRLIFKLLFFFKNFKSIRLTRYVKLFSKQYALSKLDLLGTSIPITLLSSPFFISKRDIFFCLQINSVFINRTICKNPYTYLRPGDLIEFFFPQSYLFFLKNYHFFSKNNLRKYRRKRYKNLKYNSQQIKALVWSHTNDVHRHNIISREYELDNFSLSIQVLESYSLPKSLNYNVIKKFPIYPTNYLNWKYQL